MDARVCAGAETRAWPLRPATRSDWFAVASFAVGAAADALAAVISRAAAAPMTTAGERWDMELQGLSNGERRTVASILGVRRGFFDGPRANRVVTRHNPADGEGALAPDHAGRAHRSRR